MKKRRLINLVITILIYSYCSAQQDALFTQYYDNQIYVNPAFAGSKENLNINLLHRQNWIGFEGAPVSSTLSVHTPLKYESIGLGLDVVNDKIGPLNRTTISGDFAYRIKLNDNSKLTFGLKSGIDSYSNKLSELYVTDPNDPILQSTVGKIKFNYGLGFYYLTRNWFLGGSVPRIITKSKQNSNILDEAKHLFIIAGGIIKLNGDWDLRPSTQLRFSEHGQKSLDLNLTGIYNDKLWIGCMYRLNSNAGIYCQLSVLKKFKVGYAFDFSTRGLSKQSYGSHELMLAYSLVKLRKDLTSPRYFN